MGCCITKCTSKRKRADVNPNNIQDKLVISQSPAPPSPPPKRRNVQSPPSTWFTCSDKNSASGPSSLSSASSSSSVGFSKVERSFSNDFLQSCAKENPQIIVLDPNEKIRQVKRLHPGKHTQAGTCKLSNSYTTKSIKIDKERWPNTCVNERSAMRPPSPSKRFNSHASNPVLYRATSAYSESKCLVKANSRPASPNNNVISKETHNMFMKKNKEKYGYGPGTRVEAVEVGEVLSKVNYSGPVAMVDIDNVHVALDCFIFL